MQQRRCVIECIRAAECQSRSTGRAECSSFVVKVERGASETERCGRASRFRLDGNPQVPAPDLRGFLLRFQDTSVRHKGRETSSSSGLSFTTEIPARRGAARHGEVEEGVTTTTTSNASRRADHRTEPDRPHLLFGERFCSRGVSLFGACVVAVLSSSSSSSTTVVPVCQPACLDLSACLPACLPASLPACRRTKQPQHPADARVCSAAISVEEVSSAAAAAAACAENRGRTELPTPPRPPPLGLLLLLLLLQQDDSFSSTRENERTATAPAAAKQEVDGLGRKKKRRRSVGRSVGQTE